MKKNYNVNLISDFKIDINPIKIKFNDDSYVYDFSIFNDNKVVRIFAQAFYNRYAQFTKNARLPAFRHLKIFFEYFNNHNYEYTFDIFTPKLLIGFATYLDNHSKYSLKTKYRYYNNLEIFLKEIIKLSDSPLKNLILPNCPFRKVHTESKEKTKINNEQIKQILKICYQNIEESLYIFRLGKNLIENYDSSKVLSPLNSKKIEEVVPYFYYKYGYLPSLDYPYVTKQEAWLASEAGGSKFISSYIHPTTESLLPFYLVLLIELIGNTEAVKNIKIDCIKEDILFSNRVDIIWEKPRAKKIQKRNILKNKKYGAYQIIEMIKEYTSLIRPKLNTPNNEMLFIARGNNHKNPINIIQEHTFRNELKSFIKNNLEFKFCLSDLRPSVLTDIYNKRKDIVQVSKLANHSNINTTLGYIIDKNVKKENLTYMSEKQNEMTDNLLNSQNKKIENFEINSENNSENIGFSCKNPIIKNKVCINWMAELTNPDLIIPNDEKYLSKILKLQENIKEQKNFINTEKYNLLYQPVIEIIENQILPKFNQKIINKAKKIIKETYIPSLEGY